MINYGVIVGRFQVNNLHAGHLSLFDQVAALHERVIVFIGVSASGPTRRNPLDFETRKKMVQAEYPDFMFLPIVDRKSDAVWSEDLDNQIDNIARMGKATLYGGRDSFVPHYTGKRTVVQLIIPPSISGTEIREKLTNRVMQSSDFRAGVIYSSQNQYDRTVMTVDVAILYNPGTGPTKILLGKKTGEDGWRFPGGHCVPGLSLEDNVRKEAYEETNLDLVGMQYIGSHPVKDWRWEKEKDQITTAFFMGWSTSMAGKASDDLDMILWFNLAEVEARMLENAHVPLFQKLIDYTYARGIK